MTVTVATLGFPRVGPRRELKAALERYWSGKSDQQALLAAAADLRARTWARQRDLGVDHIPSNDFSLYDHVLDTSADRISLRRVLAAIRCGEGRTT